MTMLAIGDARCSLVMMQNTSGQWLCRHHSHRANSRRDPSRQTDT